VRREICWNSADETPASDWFAPPPLPTALNDQREKAASKEKVLDALGEAASRLRTELGESLATVQKLDAPL
jgi:hypothetical protein